MKTYALLVSLFLPFFLLAQQPVYQSFEVDSIAYPQGGSDALNNFLQANIRQPMAVAAQGISGRVAVFGIVEPDGRISAVQLSRSLEPDCDQEALQVFRLFNAWLPAIKDGKPVRQRVSYSVVIKKERLFFYEHGVKTSYLDFDWLPVADTSSEKVLYKVVSRVSNDWLPMGDLFHYKRTGLGAWKQLKHYTMVREEIPRKTTEGKRIFRIGTKDPAGQWFDRRFDIDEDGKLLTIKEFNSEGLKESVVYADNGAKIEHVRHTLLSVASGFVPCVSINRWDADGQIREYRLTFPSGATERVYSLWDSKGNKIINKGQGQIIRTDTVQSVADMTRHTSYVETGRYENALKQGCWTARYADNSYFYEEEYDKGVCQRGKARKVGRDTIRYTIVEQPPEFKGGQAGLLRFIKQNLRYPSESRQAQIQGQVLIGFTIGADGTPGKYEVLESIDPRLDQEAIRLANAMSGEWQPSIRRGEPVSARFTLPVNFTLR